MQNIELIKWVDVARNKATAEMYPIMENLYSSSHYLSMNYKSETKLLQFYIFTLYSIPIPTDISTEWPLIYSNFTDLSDTWLPAKSKFTFSHNYNDYSNILEHIKFVEFEQGANKTENCEIDCGTQKYILHGRHLNDGVYTFTEY